MTIKAAEFIDRDGWRVLTDDRTSPPARAKVARRSGQVC